MRHLKSFRIFESSSEDLLGTINDILLPISDSGVKYIIENLDNIGLIHIDINGQSEEINDCVKHLENYLKDLGHGYFVGRSIKNETHISIENNFNKEIEKDFLRIIDGVKEVENPGNRKSRLFVDVNNYILFNQDVENGIFGYDFKRVYSFFYYKYSLERSVINEIIRYLVGKHLELETLTPLWLSAILGGQVG